MNCENCGTPDIMFEQYEDYVRCPKCGECYYPKEVEQV